MNDLQIGSPNATTPTPGGGGGGGRRRSGDSGGGRYGGDGDGDGQSILSRLVPLLQLIAHAPPWPFVRCLD